MQAQKEANLNEQNMQLFQSDLTAELTTQRIQTEHLSKQLLEREAAMCSREVDRKKHEIKKMMQAEIVKHDAEMGKTELMKQIKLLEDQLNDKNHKCESLALKNKSMDAHFEIERSSAMSPDTSSRGTTLADVQNHEVKRKASQNLSSDICAPLDKEVLVAENSRLKADLQQLQRTYDNKMAELWGERKAKSYAEGLLSEMMRSQIENDKIDPSQALSSVGAENARLKAQLHRLQEMQPLQVAAINSMEQRTEHALEEARQEVRNSVSEVNALGIELEQVKAELMAEQGKLYGLQMTLDWYKTRSTVSEEVTKA